MIDEILAKTGLKYEDLNSAEKETLHSMLEAVNKSTLTVEKLREYIKAMRDGVEQDLIDEPEFIRVFIFRIENRKQILLKARLKNYMLLESFLETPQKAREALERAIAGSVTRVKK